MRNELRRIGPVGWSFVALITCAGAFAYMERSSWDSSASLFTEDQQIPDYVEKRVCSANEAKIVAYQRVAKILNGIAIATEREKSCERLDNILKDKQFQFSFPDYIEPNCEWQTGRRGAQPYDYAFDFLNKYSDVLSELCDWERKDAWRRQARLQSEGAAILGSLPTEDQRRIRDEWKSYAPN